VGKEPKDAKPRSPDDESDDRPTVVPTFDPATLGGEDAAASSKGAPISASPETTQMPESMRSSLLSMADSRVPSVKPGPQRIPSMSGLAVSELDRGWEELTLDEPAAPPRTTGSDGPFRRPTDRLRVPSGERIANEAQKLLEESEKPTREHPILADEPPVSSRGVPREEPKGPARHETPEHTVFAPARAAAALTAAASRGKAVSERPAPIETPPAGAAALTPEDTVREMRDRFSLGDYTGALVLADGLLEDDPANVEVKECAENCRQVLRQMYTARIGPLDRVPVVTVARDQLRWLSIDHRAGFVLSHIDGISSLEMILDVSGMPLLDALRILCELAQQRIISFR
jgi:hypothetical protein